VNQPKQRIPRLVVGIVAGCLLGLAYSFLSRALGST
jgi:hypothetical protein